MHGFPLRNTACKYNSYTYMQYISFYLHILQQAKPKQKQCTSECGYYSHNKKSKTMPRLETRLTETNKSNYRAVTENVGTIKYIRIWNRATTELWECLHIGSLDLNSHLRVRLHPVQHCHQWNKLDFYFDCVRTRLKISLDGAILRWARFLTAIKSSCIIIAELHFNPFTYLLLLRNIAPLWTRSNT